MPWLLKPSSTGPLRSGRPRRQPLTEEELPRLTGLAGAIAAKPLGPDKLTFSGIPSFDRSPLDDEVTRAAYEGPSSLRLEAGGDELPVAHVSGTKANVMGVLQKLDDEGCVCSIPVSECDVS